MSFPNLLCFDVEVEPTCVSILVLVDVLPEPMQGLTVLMPPYSVSILVLVDVLPEPRERLNQEKGRLRVSILVLVDVLPEPPLVYFSPLEKRVLILVLVDVLPEPLMLACFYLVDLRFQSLF